MQAPSQKVLHYKAKINYAPLNKLHEFIDDFERQLTLLKPDQVAEILELRHSIYDFQLAAEREDHRLYTKIQDYESYARVQAQLQENEYALEQMHAYAQAHKRRRF
jgi:hypothetical protein